MKFGMVVGMAKGMVLSNNKKMGTFFFVAKKNKISYVFLQKKTEQYII
jgi:hypothetical protein